MNGTIRIVVAAIHGNMEAKAKESDYVTLVREYQTQIVEYQKECK